MLTVLILCMGGSNSAHTVLQVDTMSSAADIQAVEAKLRELPIRQVCQTAKVIQTLSRQYNFPPAAVNKAILNLSKRGAIELRMERQMLVNLGGS